MLLKNHESNEKQETSYRFDNLYYQKNAGWVSLPSWANFFLELGYILSQINDDKCRFTVALAVPTRSYAALLTAGGVVYGRSLLPHNISDQEYLHKIISLEDNTPIIYRDRKRKYKARKRGIRWANGKQYIVIQTDEGITNTERGISFENVRSIEIVDQDDIRLPQQQKGREIPPPSPLIRAIFDEIHVYNFMLQTRLENLIIGPQNLLREELKTNLAATQTTPGDSPGFLTDLLRVKEDQPPDISYRSSILSAVSKSSIKIASDVAPFVVIFDGPHGFVKWRDYLRRFNWVVILEHTDPNFQYAVTLLNQEYLYRAAKPHNINIPSTPSGIEMMISITDL